MKCEVVSEVVDEPGIELEPQDALSYEHLL